jgi:hypothetical protein
MAVGCSLMLQPMLVGKQLPLPVARSRFSVSSAAFPCPAHLGNLLCGFPRVNGDGQAD